MTHDIPDDVAQRIAAAVCTGNGPADSLDMILSRASGCASLLYLMADNAHTHRFDLFADDLAASLEALAADINAARALYAYLREHIDFDGRAGA